MRRAVASFRFEQERAVDQDGTEGIPTGRHWLEVADELERRPAELRERFAERYFRHEKAGDRLHISGGFHYGLIAGENRPGAGG